MAEAPKNDLERAAELFDRALLRWLENDGKPAIDRNGKPIRDKDGKLVMRPLKAADMHIVLSRLRMCGIASPTSPQQELDRLRQLDNLKLTDDMPPLTIDEAGG